MLSSHLHPEKAGAGQAPTVGFSLLEEKLCQPSLNPDIWLYFRLIQAGGAWSKDLCFTGAQGSPHPAQRLAGESCQQAVLQQAKQLLNFLLCGAALATPDRPAGPFSLTLS